MQTYQHQFNADEDLVDTETAGIPDATMRIAERAGRFSALARRYSCYADFEAAQRQRTVSDPARLAAAICDSKPTPAFIADLLYTMARGLPTSAAGDTDTDWEMTTMAIEVAGDAAYKEHMAIQRRAEDEHVAAMATERAA